MANADLEKVYKLYFNDVYLFVLRMSRNAAIAEDITSETFMKALTSLDRFEGKCDIRVWLCQIAKNSYLHFLQKRANTNSPLDEIAIADTFDIEEAFAQSETATQLHKYLHILEEPYKEVFYLRTFCALRFKEIGQIFEKSDNWACVTFHRAKAKILKEWEANQ
ncbi:MAG: sigma-70 family RNA polymerase sigma factor [Oscillospiraceae bacterium]|jgi:RNA polymerase sigma-70 factor (ECF subfamily)|nr:sigma-70 family RNA polymerase sigma factor [Oscillospiraceae bacterium]